MIRPITLLVCLAMLVGGCRSTGPSELPNGLPRSYRHVEGVNTMQATIDGVEWSANVHDFNRGYVGWQQALRFGGTSTPLLGIFIRLENVTGPGTYPLSQRGSGNGARVELPGLHGTWDLTQGSLTVTEISQDGAKGTFSFSTEPDPRTDATGSLSITKGSFDLTFD